ncbi:MAG: acyltransferase [Saccharofermentanales bacterium]
MNNDRVTSSIAVGALLDTSHTIAAGFLAGYEFPWEALPDIGSIILQIGQGLSTDEFDCRDGNVWISRTARIAPSASITGPAIIGHNSEIRHCAYIRGNALVGDNAVVGNSTELKNVILFDSVQVPHYNYVGDSVLGYKAHMGAGSITSNVKSDKSKVTVRFQGRLIETGLKKFGAILGDFVEVGCNSVMNPGTVIGRNTNIYPLTMVRGYVPEGSIVKNTGETVPKT